VEIRIEFEHVKLGLIEAGGVTVAPAGADLVRVMGEICESKRREFTVDTLPGAEPVRAVRAMFRAWGVDPSKYRPSSEALLRRVVQGKGLYHVSNLVDIGNIESIESGWPFGCYDRAKLRPPVALRLGTAGERYEGIGKRVWHLEARPVLADAEGPFGSPISDSTRTMITESTHEILAVIYAPASATDPSIATALARLRERLLRFAGAAAARSAICNYSNFPPEFTKM
jgi:DNA/RNA-binding domain of Phe-tRNA-synthetase-like protein